MDDDTKAIIKIGTEVALRPVTAIAEDALGLMGGDWLSEKRKRNREKLQARTADILKERKVEAPEEPSPSIAIPLLAHAQEESREELIDLWAKLLACAMDPARSHLYRREYVEILTKLEPLDAVVLEGIIGFGGVFINPSRIEALAAKYSTSPDRIQLSFRNLEKLELIYVAAGAARTITPSATTLARGMHDAISLSATPG